MTKTEKIDAVDGKILKDLLCNGRKEFKEIAREANVSKDVIWQHFSNLKKKGVIVGSTIQLDYRSLGYDSAASFFVDVPAQELTDVASKMRKIPGLYDAYRWGSHSRLWAVSDFMKADQIDQVKLLIKRIPSVIRLQVEIWTNSRRMPENLSVLNELCENSREKIAKGANFPKSSIIDNSIDRQLIEKLKANSRASFSELAKELGISASTVIRRYSSLNSRGIIRAIIQINPTKVGYFSTACFRLTINSEANIATVSDDICKIPDVTGVIRTIGTFDLTIFVEVKSLEHLFQVEAEIASVHGIREMDAAALNQFPVLPYPGEHMSTF